VEKTTENLLTFDVKAVLGVGFIAPHHFKLFQNISNAPAKITIDKKNLQLQHNTTGFKLGVTAFFLKQLNESNFYATEINQKGEREFEMDMQKQALFQISLESFFSYCWATITSTCREIWAIISRKHYSGIILTRKSPSIL
jgi:hypothetical protein